MKDEQQDNPEEQRYEKGGEIHVPTEAQIPILQKKQVTRAIPSVDYGCFQMTPRKIVPPSDQNIPHDSDSRAVAAPR